MKNGENKFWGTPPTKKKNGGAYNKFLSKMKKNKVVQNCLNWRENWSKMILELVSPPPNISFFGGGLQNFFVKNEKNQSCLKLPEMSRKLVENVFFTFSPSLPKK